MVSRKVPVLQLLIGSAHTVVRRHPVVFTPKVAIRVFMKLTISFLLNSTKYYERGCGSPSLLLLFLWLLFGITSKQYFFITRNLALSILKNFDLLAYCTMHTYMYKISVITARSAQVIPLLL